MPDKKQIQEKYMQMQLIEQQMQQIQKQLQLLENQLQELNLTLQALDDLKNTKPGTDILVPIASGIFFKAELKDNEELALNVGADTVVKKSNEGATSYDCTNRHFTNCGSSGHRLLAGCHC